MNERTGIVLMGIGLLLTVAGVVWLATGDFGSDAAAAPVTTTAAATTAAPTAAATTTTAGAPATTTTIASTTTTAPTMTTAAPGTTTGAPTTTTASSAETLDEFIAEYQAALADDDSGFLFDRLHPVVLALFDADTCRAYIDREIVTIASYTMTGTPTTRAAAFDTPDGPVNVDLIEAPIHFEFQGQGVDTTGQFALVDGQIRWFTQCR
jgi:hypothetical protein